MPKRTATQRHIDNINSYIDKVGHYFGTESPEYNKILATIHNAELSTYQSKSGIVKVKNTKENRKKHQKVRSIDKNKPSFARQKRRYEKEKKKIRDDIGIGDDIEENPFDKWYKGWRETWDENDQYEVAAMCDNFEIPFDYMEWYDDLKYREQILHKIYEEWIGDIKNEVNENESLNPDVGNVDETTGENNVFGNVNEGTETEIE